MMNTLSTSEPLQRLKFIMPGVIAGYGLLTSENQYCYFFVIQLCSNLDLGAVLNIGRRGCDNCEVWADVLLYASP